MAFSLQKDSDYTFDDFKFALTYFDNFCIIIKNFALNAVFNDEQFVFGNRLGGNYFEKRKILII